MIHCDEKSWHPETSSKKKKNTPELFLTTKESNCYNEMLEILHVLFWLQCYKILDIIKIAVIFHLGFVRVGKIHDTFGCQSLFFFKKTALPKK